MVKLSLFEAEQKHVTLCVSF